MHSYLRVIWKYVTIMLIVGEWNAKTCEGRGRIMLKVFLVEDEIIVREGIKTKVDWKANGFEFVGEASDGELAYPMILELKPDILITDIKMPFMDGLQLSRLIKKECPNIKIIVLSGHEEFEYAKEAISIGVAQYLLKPINGQELVNVVTITGQEILRERQNETFMEKIKKDIEENQSSKQYRLFNDIVTKKMSVSEILERSKSLSIDIMAKYYNILIYDISDTQQMMEERANYAEEIKIKIDQKLMNNNIVFHLSRGNEGSVILMKGMTLEELEETTKTYCNIIVNNVSGILDVEYFIGVGQTTDRLSGLSKCYEDACKAYAYRYIINKNHVLYANKIEEGSNETGLEFNIEDIDITVLGKSIIENFVKTGFQHEVKHVLEEYFSRVGKKNMESVLFRQYVAMNIYITCVSLAKEWGYETVRLERELGDFKKVLLKFVRVEEFMSYLVVLLETTINLRNEASSKKYGNLIDMAKYYINENFLEEELSLNQVSAKVGLSASHFSTIFSQETGETFIEYLTLVRMEKAKELLCCSNLKCSEIGYAIGYKDAHYFSYLFKKTQSCTPKEYRARGNAYESTKK